MNNIPILFLHVFIFVNFPSTESAKILAVTFYPSYSHQVGLKPIWRELSLRGHNVTSITPIPWKDPSLTNLTEIDVGFVHKIAAESNLSTNLSKSNRLINNFLWLHKYATRLTEEPMKREDVQKVIRNRNEHFDIVIVEGLLPLIYAYGGRFHAPIVGVSSLSPFLHSHDLMGNPTHPIYPDLLTVAVDDYSFTYRLKGFLYNIWYRALFYWYILPKEDKLARKYFGDDLPYLGDILMNTSLLLVNVNPVMHIPRPNVPNVIEISQMHIRDKLSLPKDLQDFLDSSKKGAVYFSLGSNILNRNLSPNFIEAIIKAFAELPYNILWKSDVDYVRNISNNVLIRKWLPQQDILGHPKVKVFVTQGGVQSIEEAIYHGVPMVGIPFLADQPQNIKTLSEKEMAVPLNFETMMKDDLKRAIVEVVENEQYKNNIAEAARILKDQPLKGVDKAVYWIEYVIRHKGAKHLRSPAADMPYYKYFMVDVAIFLLAVCCFCVFIIGRLYPLLLKKNEKVKMN
nr:UDP-glucuronosyltransferase 2B33-like [Leptinotarsa decemlineata]